MAYFGASHGRAIRFFFFFFFKKKHRYYINETEPEHQKLNTGQERKEHAPAILENQ
jgi:hypothetical protein